MTLIYRDEVVANEKRLYDLANRGLAKLGMTREELHRKLGLPPP